MYYEYLLLFKILRPIAQSYCLFTGLVFVCQGVALKQLEITFSVFGTLLILTTLILKICIIIQIQRAWCVVIRNFSLANLPQLYLFACFCVSRIVIGVSNS